MFLFYTLFFISLALLAHEYGHADALRRIGRNVSELGFGIPFGPSLRFRISGSWAKTTFTAYPLPLGAYVRYDDAEPMDYHDTAFVNGAGPLASFIAGWSMQALAYLVGFTDHAGLTWSKVVGSEGFYFPVAMLTISALVVLLMKQAPYWKKFFFSYFAPIISICAVGWIISFIGSLVSIVGIAERANEISELSGALYFAGKVSVAVGLGMLLPIYPLDGGQTFRAIVKSFGERFVEPFERYGVMIFGLLIIYTLQKDIMPLLLPFFQRIF